MANNVTHKLLLKGDNDKIQKVLEFIQIEPTEDEDGYNIVGLGTIDFNKIVPMPEDIFRGNLGKEERKKYGDRNWYDWSRKNWGTKWNAYNCQSDLENNIIYFDTAWSAVPGLIGKLSSMFPEVTFELSYADEDFGYNTGIVHFRNGDVIYSNIMEGGSKEAIKNAEEVLGYTLDYNEK